jgi:tRNA1Val (adenine37-N6)-methyltransferase
MKVTTDACLFGAWMAESVKREKVNVKTALDMGVGTGLLSLMLAQKNPRVIIDAIEIDEDAFQQAKENIKASPFADRINIIHADVREFQFEKKYDFIITNPPFYERELKSEDEKKNLAHHAGISFGELMTIIKNNLQPGGSFYLLLPYKRNKEISKIILENEVNFLETVFIRQSTKHDYFRMIISGKIKDGSPAETVINEISIRDEHQQYTKEFIELLKDYYLYL